jgi:hypothetical protein
MTMRCSEPGHRATVASRPSRRAYIDFYRIYFPLLILNRRLFFCDTILPEAAVATVELSDTQLPTANVFAVVVGE